MTKLLFCAGAPNPDLSVLNEPFDCYIGVDGGCQVLIDAGITLDFAIGDFDSMSVPIANEVVELPCQKDETDLQYALSYVLKNTDATTIDQIVIIGALTMGRLDHLICNFYLAYDKYLQQWFDKLIFIEKNNSVQFYLPGTHYIRKLDDKFYLSIIPMTPVEQLHIQQAKYTLDKTTTLTPVAYISNEFIGKEAIISFSRGIVCVMQTTDRNLC